MTMLPRKYWLVAPEIRASRMAESKVVAASSISVETLNGVVMLSGFAKNTLEKTEAERIARGVNNVKSVRNEIAIRP